MSTTIHSPDTNEPTAPAAPVDPAVAEALRLAGDRSSDALALLRENVRLQCLYPNEYVAYTDCWQSQGNQRTLFRRVVAHGGSLPELYQAIAMLPSQDRSAVIIDYATDVDQELLNGRDELDPGKG